MKIPSDLLSLCRERSSSSLRSVCQQRVAGTSNWEGRQERMMEMDRSLGRDAQRRGQSSHGLSEGSQPAFPFASAHNSLSTFTKVSTQIWAQPPKITFRPILSFSTPYPTFLFFMAQTTMCRDLAH